MQHATMLIYRITITALLVLVLPSITHSVAPQTVGLFVYDAGAYEGYTLIAPNRSTTTYLIDNYGRYIHSWPSSYTPGLVAYLLENGNLLRTAQLSGGGGGGGRVEEIAWDGTLVWAYDYYVDGVYLQHHDVERLPNGNTLILAWEYKTDIEAIAAGRNPATVGLMLQTEHIIEVEPTGPTSGNIVWRWHAWDHLIQDFDPTKDNYGVVADHPELLDINFARPFGGVDWIHANSIDYHPEFDQILISAHNMGECWVIDHSTTTAEATGHTGGNSGMGGDFLYRWGNPKGYDAGVDEDQVFFLQHDAAWVEPGRPGEGNITIFNNGGGRPEGNYSSVDEFVPSVDGDGNYPQPSPGVPHDPAALSWTYVADPPGDFYSQNISGAQRQPDSTTLICEGSHGRLFEVTPDGEIVWEYINPVIAGGPVNQGDAIPTGQNAVFRCYRYAADYPGLAGRDLTPGSTLEIYPVDISGTSHSPSAPTDSDSVVVTAMIANDDPIALAELHADTGTGYFTITMYDDGNHHDGGAGDSLFGAVIPPTGEGTSVSYYIYAMVNIIIAAHDPPAAPSITYGYAGNTLCDCTGLGDMDFSETIDPLDVTILVNYVYKGYDSREPMPPTCPVENGDWDCDVTVSPLDVAYCVNYVYKTSGVLPCDPCSP